MLDPGGSRLIHVLALRGSTFLVLLDPTCGSWWIPVGHPDIPKWLILMDPRGRMWWIMVDQSAGCQWIHMIGPVGSTWWILVGPNGETCCILMDPSGGFWWILLVALGGSTWQFLGDPSCVSWWMIHLCIKFMPNQHFSTPGPILFPKIFLDKNLILAPDPINKRHVDFVLHL